MIHTAPSSTASPLRVGYLLRMYPRFTQTFVVNEILELERQGTEVGILSLRKPTDGRFHESFSRVRAVAEYLPELYAEDPARIRRVHWRQWRRSGGAYLRAYLEARRHRGVASPDFLQAPLVLQWVRKQKRAHVHVHFGSHEASVAYLAHVMGGLSYSMTLHAFDIFRANVDRPLLARKINASRYTVTVSRYNKEFMVEHLPGVDPEKIRVQYNGIDLDRFAPSGVPPKPYSLLAVGRLIEKKGFIHLVRAVGHLRDRGLPAVCTIVGDGPEEPKLRAEIERLDLADRVTLAGPLPQAEVCTLLAESACFVLPCVQAADGNVDALPTVLLEAMACGCPCVSTRLSGVPEIIEDKRSGLLVTPQDDLALADAVARVLTCVDLRRSYAEEGRRRVEILFDVRRNVGAMRAWFRDVVEQRARASAPVCGTGFQPVNHRLQTCATTRPTAGRLIDPAPDRVVIP